MSYSPYRPPPQVPQDAKTRAEPGLVVPMTVLACALGGLALLLWLIGVPGWVPLCLLLAMVVMLVAAARWL